MPQASVQPSNLEIFKKLYYIDAKFLDAHHSSSAGPIVILSSSSLPNLANSTGKGLGQYKTCKKELIKIADLISGEKRPL